MIQLMPFYGDGQSTASTEYMYAGLGNTNAQEFQRTIDVPIAGTIRNLRLIIDTVPGGSASWRVVLEKNNVDQAIDVTLNSGDTDVSDTSEVTLAADDQLVFRVIPTNTPATTAFHGCIEYEWDTAQRFVLFGDQSNASAVTTLLYYNFLGSGDDANGNWRTSSGGACVAPNSGTLKAIYCWLSADPTPGSYTFQLYEGAADSTSGSAVSGTDFTINAGSTSGSITGLSIPITAGSLYALGRTGAASPAGVYVGWAFVIEPDTDGEWWLGGHIGIGERWQTSGRTFHSFNVSRRSESATENDRYGLGHHGLGGVAAATYSRLYKQMEGTPGGAASYDFIVRKDKADTSLAVNIGSAAESGNDVADSVEFTSALELSLACDANSTPTARSSSWSMIGLIQTTQIIRPNATSASGSWVADPSGTLHGVTSDQDTGTHADHQEGSSTMTLVFEELKTPQTGTGSITVTQRVV